MFRKTFDLEVVPSEALARITADSRYVLWVNGREARRRAGEERSKSGIQLAAPAHRLKLQTQVILKLYGKPSWCYI